MLARGLLVSHLALLPQVMGARRRRLMNIDAMPVTTEDSTQIVDTMATIPEDSTYVDPMADGTMDDTEVFAEPTEPESAEEASVEEATPVKETPEVEAAPVEEAPEEPAPVMEAPVSEEPAPVVEEAPEEPAPVVETPAVDPVVEEPTPEVETPAVESEDNESDDYTEEFPETVLHELPEEEPEVEMPEEVTTLGGDDHDKMPHGHVFGGDDHDKWDGPPEGHVDSTVAPIIQETIDPWKFPERTFEEPKATNWEQPKPYTPSEVTLGLPQDNFWQRYLDCEAEELLAAGLTPQELNTVQAMIQQDEAEFWREKLQEMDDSRKVEELRNLIKDVDMPEPVIANEGDYWKKQFAGMSEAELDELRGIAPITPDEPVKEVKEQDDFWRNKLHGMNDDDLNAIKKACTLRGESNPMGTVVKGESEPRMSNDDEFWKKQFEGMTDEELKELHKPFRPFMKPEVQEKDDSQKVFQIPEDLLDKIMSHSHDRPHGPPFGKGPFGGRGPHGPEHMKMVQELVKALKDSMYNGSDEDWMHQIHLERETRFKVMVQSVQARHAHEPHPHPFPPMMPPHGHPHGPPKATGWAHPNGDHTHPWGFPKHDHPNGDHDHADSDHTHPLGYPEHSHPSNSNNAWGPPPHPDWDHTHPWGYPAHTHPNGDHDHPEDEHMHPIGYPEHDHPESDHSHPPGTPDHWHPPRDHVHAPDYPEHDHPENEPVHHTPEQIWDPEHAYPGYGKTGTQRPMSRVPEYHEPIPEYHDNMPQNGRMPKRVGGRGGVYRISPKDRNTRWEVPLTGQQMQTVEVSLETDYRDLFMGVLMGMLMMGIVTVGVVFGLLKRIRYYEQLEAYDAGEDDEFDRWEAGQEGKVLVQPQLDDDENETAGGCTAVQGEASIVKPMPTPKGPQPRNSLKKMATYVSAKMFQAKDDMSLVKSAKKPNAPAMSRCKTQPVVEMDMNNFDMQDWVRERESSRSLTMPKVDKANSSELLTMS